MGSARGETARRRRRGEGSRERRGRCGRGPGDRLRLTLGAPHPALRRALSRLPGLLPGRGEPGGGAPSPYLWW